MNLKLLADKLTILNSAVLESLNAGSEEEVIKKYTHRGLDLLSADFGYAWFRSSQSKRFALSYSSPSMPYVPEYPRKNGMTAQAIEKGAPIFIPKIIEKRKVKRDAKEYMKSAVVIPITYKKNTYGIFVLAFKKEREFQNEERDLATALGNSAAQSITINRLYADLRDFKHTLDNTLDGIVIFDADSTKVQYANLGAAELTGKKLSQLVRKPFTTIVDGLKGNELEEKMDEIASNNQLPFFGV